MILLIDNYDSFTYNLYQYASMLGREVTVVRNDQATAAELAAGDWEAVWISPGPGTPQDAGITLELIRQLAGRVPIFGICLGHQAIAEAFGGKVIRAPLPMHGKVSPITHNGEGLYAGLPNPLSVGRYHSLMVEEASLPECLTVTARSEDGCIMGVAHRQWPIIGVQYHPESILTPDGLQLLTNLLSA